VGFVVDEVALGEVFPRVLRFSPVSLILPVLHCTEKLKKIVIFITGLHNKPQGCGASVASAAGPFTTKRTWPDLHGKKNRNPPFLNHHPVVCNRLFKFFVSVNTTLFTCTVYFLYNMFRPLTPAIIR
jgi:hypothetical protein